MPPRVSNARRVPERRAPAPAPGPSPSVPAASASVSAAIRHTTPVRIGRAGGRSSRARISAAGERPARPAPRSRARRTRTAVARTAPSPSAPPAQCGVGDAAEEDPDRDQRQRDDVEVVGLEHRVAGSRGPAGEQRALGARRWARALARLALLARWPCPNWWLRRRAGRLLPPLPDRGPRALIRSL